MLTVTTRWEFSPLVMRCLGSLAVSAALIAGTKVTADETAQKPPSQPAAEHEQPPLRVMQTPTGTHFGVFREKPAAPAPTLFILAAGIDAAGNDSARTYTITGRELAKDGWLYVVLDPPCHGYDHREDEPAGLDGWAHRVKEGQDLMGPFVKSCVDVLNHLIAEGYTDPERVAVCGTSRGGFCALHFAAGDPRIRAVTAVSPVTNPLALSEFAGVTPEQVQAIQVVRLVERLAGKAVLLSIGNDDNRVSTQDCVAFAQTLVTATRRLRPELPVIPVELMVGPTAGHQAVDDAYLLEARFLRQWLR